MATTLGPVTCVWLAEGMCRIAGETGAVCYTDPVSLEETPHDGDLIVVTEPARFDAAAIEQVRHPDGFVLAAGTVDGASFDVEPVEAGESLVLGPLDIVTTSLPDRSGACGYGITIDGIRAFWPGQLSVSPDASVGADLLLVPLGSLGLEAALEFVTLVDPDVAVPVAYDDRTVDIGTFVQRIAERGVAVALDES